VLIVDTREPLDLVARTEELFLSNQVPVEIRGEEAGDYLFLYEEGPLTSVAISRKSLPDFRSSLFKGNLETDLSKCLDGGFDKVILLVEGAMGVSHGKVCRLKVLDTKDYLYSVNMEMVEPGRFANLWLAIQAQGVDIVWSPSIEDTPGVLMAMWRYLKDPAHSFLQRYVRIQRSRGTDLMTRQADALMGLWPHLPEDVAKAILGYCGGMRATLAALVEEPEFLLRVKGVGHKRLGQVKELL